MPKQVTVQRENRTLDVFKFMASILVTASHLPSLFASDLVRAYYTGWFFRFCVPLFFASAGYYFQRSRNQLRTVKRMAWLFALSYVLYLPQILAGSGDWGEVFSRLRWNLVVGYEHLWYLNAALAGLLIWYLLERIPVCSRLLRYLEIPVSILLLLLGAMLDGHYQWIGLPLLSKAGIFLSAFGGPRNVLFMGLPLMLMGGSLARYENTVRRIPTWVLVLLWAGFRALAFLEFGWLREKLGTGANADLSLFGMWPGLVLLELSFRIQLPLPERTAKLLRRLSEYIYILHPMILLQISACLAVSPLQLLIATIAMCALVYILLEKQFS